jgi:hypothetical protein
MAVMGLLADPQSNQARSSHERKDGKQLLTSPGWLMPHLLGAGIGHDTNGN